MNEENPNPYQPPPEHVEGKTSARNLFPLGVSLLGTSLLYIVLMLTNISVCLPGAFGDSGDRSFYIKMLIYHSIILAYNIFLSAGAVSIIQRRRYTLAYFSCFLAMVPVLGPCMFLGIPIGAWGLIKLTKKEVEASFL